MGKKIAAGLGLGIIAIATFFGLVYVFQYVWNMVMPEVLGLKVISYFQAFGILFLSRMLFGGFGFRWMNNGGKSKFWKERMHMKMCNMNEDEKEEFKRKLKEKCSGWGD
jgi:Ca2+/H+ antiporter, TMEM165/GDT1 family